MDTFNNLPAQITCTTQSGRQFDLNTEDGHGDKTNDRIFYEDTMDERVKLYSAYRAGE